MRSNQRCFLPPVLLHLLDLRRPFSSCHHISAPRRKALLERNELGRLKWLMWRRGAALMTAFVPDASPSLLAASYCSPQLICLRNIIMELPTAAPRCYFINQLQLGGGTASFQDDSSSGLPGENNAAISEKYCCAATEITDGARQTQSSNNNGGKKIIDCLAILDWTVWAVKLNGFERLLAISSLLPATSRTSPCCVHAFFSRKTIKPQCCPERTEATWRLSKTTESKNCLTVICKIPLECCTMTGVEY